MTHSVPEAAEPRRQSAQSVVGSFKMESVEVLPLTCSLLEQWVSGEVTAEEAVQEYLHQAQAGGINGLGEDSSQTETAFFNAALLRNIGLEEKPIQGSFDPYHLMRIHACLFQDEELFRKPSIKGGKIRKPTPQDWFKRRKLNTIKLEQNPQHYLDVMQPTSMAVYSRMDRAAEIRFFDLLDNADPTELASLQKMEAAARLARLFEELDYIHPFNDGNSRTIRTFVRQFAGEGGYELDWSKISQAEEAREVFYIARDLASLERGMDSLSDFYQDMARSRLEVFKDFPTLGKLIEKALEKKQSPH